MNIRDWFNVHKESDKREQLASAAGTTVGYLEQIVYEKKKPGVNLCREIYTATLKVSPDHIIYPADLRPDIAEIFCVQQEDEAA